MRIFQGLIACALYLVVSYAQEACDSITVTHVSQDIPCATIGSLTIDPNLSGTLSLDGVRQIQDLQMIGNTGLENLTSASLSRVNAGIYVSHNSSLGEIRLPNLSLVDTFSVRNSTNLSKITLGEEGVATAKVIMLESTGLIRFQLNLASVDFLQIRNNRYLYHFTSDLEILAGGGRFDLEASDSTLQLPNMTRAGGLSVAHVRYLNMQSLVSVNTSVGFENNMFTSLSLPVLETITGDLSVTNNTNMVAVDFPQLEKVEGLTVAHNPFIVELDGFPNLGEVSEKVELEGDFKYVEMPSLTNAAGGLWVTSSENITFSCAALEESFQSERPHQSFECRGSDGGNDTDGSSPAGTNGGSEGELTTPGQSSSGTLSGGAIAGIVVGILVATGVLAAVLFNVWRRRRKGAGASKADTADRQDPRSLQLHHDQPELQGVPRSELAVPDLELEGSKVNGVYHETDGTVIHEMEGTARERRV